MYAPVANTIRFCIAAAFFLICSIGGFSITEAQAQSAYVLKNKWKGNYIFAQGNRAQMGTSKRATQAKWLLEQVNDGGKTFYEFHATGTNNYLHIERGSLELGPRSKGWWSSQWELQSAGDGSQRIRNRWKPNIYLHIERGQLEAGQIKQGWWSARWLVQSVSGANQSAANAAQKAVQQAAAAARAAAVRAAQDKTVAFRNRWKGSYIGVRSGRSAMLRSAREAGSRWLMEPVSVAGKKVFELRAKGTNSYLHIERGPLQLSNRSKGWWSSQWELESAGGRFQRLKNRWKPNIYLHIERGVLEASEIRRGWHSAQWTIEGRGAAQVNVATAAGGDKQRTLGTVVAPNIKKRKPAATTEPEIPTLTVENQYYPNLNLMTLDAEEKPQIVVALPQGNRIAQRVNVGQSYALATDTEWVTELFTANGSALQKITVQRDGQLAFEQPPRKPLAGEPTLVVTNNYYPTMDVSLIADQELTLLGSVARGETFTTAVKEGQKFGFSANENWVNDGYVVNGNVGQTIVFEPNGEATLDDGSDPQPEGYQPPSGQVPAGQSDIVVTNKTRKVLAIAVIDGDNSEKIVDLDPGQRQTVRVRQGLQLGFYDEQAEIYVGDDFPVARRSQQAVSIPYLEPGKIAITLYNSGNVPLALGKGGAGTRETVGIGTLAPRTTKVVYAKPSDEISCFNPNTNVQVGGVYTVKLRNNGRVNLPIKKGDKNADGVVSRAEIKKVAAKIAIELAKQSRQAGQRSSADVCWKDTYGRGVGTIPTKCRGQRPDKDAGLCYPYCKAGYNGVGPVCWSRCPAGFTNDGAFCRKPGPVKRAAFEVKIGDIGDQLGSLFSKGKFAGLDVQRKRCRNSRLGRKYGCVSANGGTIVYSKCPRGYKQAPVITNLCTPICPSHMTDIGVSCAKATYGRGVGRIPQCNTSEQKDAGLCYKRCNAGYTGVGPVCWNKCPGGWTNCGASCARTKAQCVMSVVDQVSSPLVAAGSIALIGVTAGGATAATAGAQAAKAGAKIAAKAAAKAGAKAAAKAALRAKVKALLKSGAMAGFKAGAKEAAIDAAVGTAFSAAMATYSTVEGKRQFREQVKKEVRSELAKGISDETIDAAVQAAIEGQDANNGFADNFAWDALDPTGIASIVVAYNNPICSNVR